MIRVSFSVIAVFITFLLQLRLGFNKKFDLTKLTIKPNYILLNLINDTSICQQYLHVQ